MAIYHIAKTGSDNNLGTEERPFLTIGRVSSILKAGDTVIVHQGIYREWVKPEISGTKLKRITYKAANNEHVRLTGAEVIKGWKSKGNGVWTISIDNSFFGSYNPFSDVLSGDWYLYPLSYPLHTAEIYINGKAMYEAARLDDVYNPPLRKEGVGPDWVLKNPTIADSSFTVYTWHSSVDENTTTIWAAFHDINPNEECVEINVRKAVFFPEKTGIDYITVSGFELDKAATQWAPPTANQPGLIGPNWAKGWIIENCDIHDSKCAAISLGKDYSTGENESTNLMRKPGYHYQMEVVFRALSKGWSKESVGSHIVRSCRIHDSGQNGIVGHLGCIFSQIYDNEIWNIGIKHEFFGHEIAAIKLHAAIDTQIYSNYIHNSTLGTWLDWQAQGVRLKGNVYRNNERDFFIEVTHGPHIVDNNIFASPYSFDNVAQGGAYINNIFSGTIRRISIPDRATPYHYAHTTKIAGVSTVYGGDDRIISNIFLGDAPIISNDTTHGTISYEGLPSSLEEYIRLVSSSNAPGDHERFNAIKQHAFICSNAYANGAKGIKKERDAIYLHEKLSFSFEEEEDGLYIIFDSDFELASSDSVIAFTQMLETPRLSECPYENPDGSPILFDNDIRGKKRNHPCPPGPFATIKAGRNKIKVWPCQTIVERDLKN